MNLHLIVSLTLQIMPHNLYLHSSIVRYRSHTESQSLGEIREILEPLIAESSDHTPINIQPRERRTIIPQSLRYSNLDSIMALSGALLVNSAILIVASAAFNLSGDGEVAEIKDAYLLLKQHLGPAAGFAFAVALFCAGQSSTITGTLAGQIVTEGFLGPMAVGKFHPALQRLATRVLAIAPAMTAALVTGDVGMNQLLVLSQVVLSLQLPFAIWPLIWITCGGKNGTAMNVQFRDDNGSVEAGVTEETVVDFSNSLGLKVTAIIIGVFITAFNIILLWKMLF